MDFTKHNRLYIDIFDVIYPIFHRNWLTAYQAYYNRSWNLDATRINSDLLIMYFYAGDINILNFGNDVAIGEWEEVKWYITLLTLSINIARRVCIHCTM